MDDQYYQTLPKKRMGAGALILNENNEILFVKPSYKDYWSIPGGVVEEDESPRAACQREIKEEIGLSLGNLKFLGVDYIADHGVKGENLQFVFFGGKLSQAEIKNIKVDGQEISEYKFLKIDEALRLLNEKAKRRLPKCLEALKDQTAVYLEAGE